MNRVFSALPYREAKNFTRVIPPIKKRLIVIHAMEYPEKPKSADWCARYFAGLEGEAPRASAHACVDDAEIVQCVPWQQIAWHAPGANRLGIGIEHAGMSSQTPAEWQDAYSAAMLDNSAWLVAHLCSLFMIPVDFIDAGELAAERDRAAGITTHAEVTKAFQGSTHTDPGKGFPLGEYLRLVSKYALDAEVGV